MSDIKEAYAFGIFRKGGPLSVAITLVIINIHFLSQLRHKRCPEDSAQCSFGKEVFTFVPAVFPFSWRSDSPSLYDTVNMRVEPELLAPEPVPIAQRIGMCRMETIPVLAPRYLGSAANFWRVSQEAANRAEYISLSYRGSNSLNEWGNVKTIW